MSGNPPKRHRSHYTEWINRSRRERVTSEQHSRHNQHLTQMIPYSQATSIMPANYQPPIGWPYFPPAPPYYPFANQPQVYINSAPLTVNNNTFNIDGQININQGTVNLSQATSNSDFHIEVGEYKNEDQGKETQDMGKDSEGGTEVDDVQVERRKEQDIVNEIHSEGGTEVNDQDSVSNNIVHLHSEGGEDINEVQEEGGEGGGWSCIQCTLLNRAGHLACSACGETRFPNDTAGDIGNRSGGGEDDVNENGSVRGGEDEDIDSILNPIYIQGSTQQRPKISLDQANVRLFEELGNCIFCTGAIDNGKPFVQCSCSCKMFYHKGCFGRHLAAGMPFCPTCRADLRK